MAERIRRVEIRLLLFVVTIICCIGVVAWAWSNRSHIVAPEQFRLQHTYVVGISAGPDGNPVAIDNSDGFQAMAAQRENYPRKLAVGAATTEWIYDTGPPASRYISPIRQRVYIHAEPAVTYNDFPQATADQLIRDRARAFFFDGKGAEWIVEAREGARAYRHIDHATAYVNRGEWKPYWPGIAMNAARLVAIGALGISPLLVVRIYQVRRQITRLEHGACERCGYDLAGAEHVRCPECGFAVPVSNAP